MTDRTVLIRIKANASDLIAEAMKAKAALKSVGDDIDSTNDRTAWMVQGIMALGPALVPIGAAAVPILAGIATQAVIGAGAIATMALAFNGVGDAIGAINDYELDPTTANFEKLRAAMAELGPEGAEFVRFLDKVGEELNVLQMDARGGMFPGLTEGIEDAMSLLPRMRSLVTDIARGLGTLGADAGAGLAGPEFEEFFEYLDREARPLLVEMGRTIGNFIDGFASILVAFGPLTSDFSGGMLEMSRSFERWAEGLQTSETFQEFVGYIRDVAPDVRDLAGAFADMFVEIVQAAAPLGKVALPALEGLADAIAAIADTPLGTLVLLGGAIQSLIGRYRALRDISTGGAFGAFTGNFSTARTATKTAATGIRSDINSIAGAYRVAGVQGARFAASTTGVTSKLTTAARAAGPAAGQLALLGVAMSGVAESFGATNTVMGALLGSSFGKKFGVIGTAIGLALDAKQANDDWKESIEGVDAAIETNNIDVLTQKLEDLQKRYDDVNSTTSFGDFLSDAQNTLGNALEGDFTDATQSNALQGAIDEVQAAVTDLLMQQYVARKALGGYADIIEGAGMAGFGAAHGIDALTAAIAAQQSQARGALDATYAWGQAVIDLRNRVKEGKDGFNEFTQAGQDNYAAIKAGADAFNNAAPKEQTVERYKQVRAQLIAFAKQLGAAGPLAERLVDDLLNIPKKLATDYAIRYDRRQLQTAVNAYRELPKDVQTYIRAHGIPRTRAEVNRLVEDYKLTEKERRALITLTDNASGRIQMILGLLRDADGFHANSTITLTRETIYKTSGIPQSPPGGGDPLRDPVGGADGGTVAGAPRLPYADKVRMWLAPGEEIISNRYGEADMFRAHRAAGLIPRYSGRAVNSEIAGGARSVAGAFGGSRTVVEVIVRGEMDLRRAKAQIQGLARSVSRDEIGQEATWARTQRRG